MTAAALLAGLALFDVLLAGFRASAGRDGRIEKRTFYRIALVRGALAGVALVAVACAVAALLVKTAPDPDATWRELVHAGTTCVWVFGAFATATLAALALWFVPVPEIRVLASVIVLGPFTMLRPLVITGGLLAGALSSTEPRVWVLAAVAGVAMLGIERALGRGHVERWRQLVQRH